MRTTARRPLPRDPEENVRSAVLSIDVDGAGRLRLDTSWSWDLPPWSDRERALSPHARRRAAPLVVDLDGDGRDAIVTWRRRLMVIGSGGRPDRASRLRASPSRRSRPSGTPRR
jgi:hypothetical protein